MLFVTLALSLILDSQMSHQFPHRLLFLLSFCLTVTVSAAPSVSGGTCPSKANMDGGVYAAPTSCYYVDFSGGADTNSGTTESAPWRHAPGMRGCSSNCSVASVGAGTGIIFKGGVTWDYTIRPWVAPSSGSSAGNDAYGGCTGANCTYWGVDKSWFSGASWSRPIFDGGGWATAPIGSGLNWKGGTCKYDSDAGDAQEKFFKPLSDAIVDNLEFRGMCLGNPNVPPGGNNPSYLSDGGAFNVTIENVYIHQYVYNIGSDSNLAAACDAIGMGRFHLTYSVMDFSDSGPATTFETGDHTYSCAGTGGRAYEDHNVFANMGACENEITLVSRHDNLFINCYAIPWGTGFHEHVSNDGNPPSNGFTATVYNNVVMNTTTSAAQDYGFAGDSGINAENIYWFNDLHVTVAPPFAAYMGSQSGNSAHVFNNTIEATDSAFGGPGGSIVLKSGGTSTSLSVGNLHAITSSSRCNIFNVGNGSGAFAAIGTWTTSAGTTTNASFSSYPGCPVADLVVQTQSTANGQGYKINQTYMFSPTSETNATVGVGVNHTADCDAIAASNAATAAADAAACRRDTSYAVTYNTSNHTAVNSGRVTNARPTSGAWDVGAYQFASGPNPPTGLAAVAQ